MLYVQQSLSPQEEILMSARFHWVYTLQAIFWILFGLGLGIGLGYGAIWYEVSGAVRHLYGEGLPDELRQLAWDRVVTERGGYLKILWEQHIVIRMGILMMFVVGLYLFGHMMMVKATTEIAVTTERLVYKKGLIARHVGELNVDRIEGVSVQQGVLGRMCNYGRVCIRGMGVGEVMLPVIEDPIEFRKAVNEAKSRLDRGGYHRASDDF
jgi:Bacterial PH domain